MAAPTMKTVIDFFKSNVPADSVAPELGTAEFSKFWKSCTDEEKNYYKAAAAEALGV